MRTWLYNLIKALNLPLDMENRVISSGAASNPARPFLIVSLGVEDRPLGVVKEQGTFHVPFTVWVHDVPGSMLNIDEACRLLKDNLPNAAPAVVGAVRVSELEWLDTGHDAYDDHFATNTRPVNFRIRCRR